MTNENRDDLWVFGYGSLMWRPDFAFAERRMARLAGYRRRFCLKSIRYRGTPEAPGLVLGLDADPEGWCDGVAFRVPGPEAAAVHGYLRERELVTYAYRETMLAVRLDDGRDVPALAYVVDRGHVQYAGALTPEEQAAVIAESVGPMGPNRDYL
jgi:glutathione-specific gamma-glutamylcyclotransferase